MAPSSLLSKLLFRLNLLLKTTLLAMKMLLTRSGSPSTNSLHLHSQFL